MRGALSLYLSYLLSLFGTSLLCISALFFSLAEPTLGREFFALGLKVFLREFKVFLREFKVLLHEFKVLARAVVAKPRLIFLDEATSALDSQTQDQVSRQLNELQATRIVIAHRLSTIKKADRIYVLKDGVVAQVGTFSELLAVPGPFRELAQRQLL